MIRLVAITVDEIQTVADISGEMIRRGDVRGYTLKTIVEEFANSTARAETHTDGWSVRVPDMPPRFRVIPGDAA